MHKPIVRALTGECLVRRPVWLMRQAGRYLPEYREIRARARSFLDFCYSPALACEATVQPIRRFGFDAAILFSDILVVPDALGQSVTFESGEGPRLEPIVGPADLCRLKDEIDIERLAPVFETIGRVKDLLPEDVALIGFCGAPWTVASYMVAGRGTTDQCPARLFAYRNPALFEILIGKLVHASIVYLSAQVSAGAEVVQIFDSWAGVLPADEFERWCFKPLVEIVSGLRKRHPDIPIIGFARGSGHQSMRIAQASGVDGVSLDTSIDMRWAASEFPRNVALQGNLDPLVLLAGGEVLARSIQSILNAVAERAHIFNLGHGVLPETPVRHVEDLMRQLRRHRPEIL